MQAPVPVPVTQDALAIWLAFATPVTVAILGCVQIYIATKQTRKINEIHSFTNSALGAALKAKAAALRMVAVYSKDPLDEKAANIAEAEFNAHDAIQKAMDAKKAA
jgi:hypothetical protein